MPNRWAFPIRVENGCRATGTPRGTTMTPAGGFWPHFCRQHSCGLTTAVRLPALTGDRSNRHAPFVPKVVLCHAWKRGRSCWCPEGHPHPASSRLLAPHRWNECGIHNRGIITRVGRQSSQSTRATSRPKSAVLRRMSRQGHIAAGTPRGSTASRAGGFWPSSRITVATTFPRHEHLH